MIEMKISSIGTVVRSENEILLKRKNKYKSGLTSLDKFSPVIVVWWADGHEDKESRQQVRIFSLRTAASYSSQSTSFVFEYEHVRLFVIF